MFSLQNEHLVISIKHKTPQNYSKNVTSNKAEYYLNLAIQNKLYDKTKYNRDNNEILI